MTGLLLVFGLCVSIVMHLLHTCTLYVENVFVLFHLRFIEYYLMLSIIYVTPQLGQAIAIIVNQLYVLS